MKQAAPSSIDHGGLKRRVSVMPRSLGPAAARSAGSSRHRAGLSLRRLVRIPRRQTADEHKRNHDRTKDC
jgi:hypothetical protein